MNPIQDPVYEPQEDSQLLLHAIQDFFKKHPTKLRSALDMGCGSGIQALELCAHATEVLAADKNPAAVDATIRVAQDRRIGNLTVVLSDLFSKVKGRFDLIVFNPPYLPFDPKTDAPDPALSPGDKDASKGNETIIEFAKHTKKHLTPQGHILLLFSSLSGPEEIYASFRGLGFAFHRVAHETHFMEDLYVFELHQESAH